MAVLEVTCLGAGCQGKGGNFAMLHYIVYADSQVAIQNAGAIHFLSRTWFLTVPDVFMHLFMS